MSFRLLLFVFFLLSALVGYGQPAGKWEIEADTLAKHEEWEKAVSLYSKVIGSASASNAVVLPIFLKRAMCLYSLNRMEEALKDLNAYLSQDAENLQAILMRAYALKVIGPSFRQLPDLNHALVLRPGNPDILKWRSTAYLEAGKYDSARTDLKHVIAVADDPEVELYLAMSYYYDGKVDSALVSLNKSIELDPSNPAPYLYGASFCIDTEQYSPAINYANVALKIDPKNADALLYRGIALLEMGQEKEGCRSLTKALAAGQDQAVDYLKEKCYGIED